jgi:hypothetical protein
MLFVTVKIGAVNVFIGWFSAVKAFAGYLIFFCEIYRNRNSFIEYIALAFEQFAFYFGIVKNFL